MIASSDLEGREMSLPTPSPRKPHPGRTGLLSLPGDRRKLCAYPEVMNILGLCPVLWECTTRQRSLGI